ncbi:hypothetical protein BN946_scf184753.g4 [Trametes cinnabarina]|uniref:Uncharacterized protein n=1 Tax=Pycnoporus cinnabarinus TaxID=5643 RepID=A0A060SYD5_PYCCI|nr:hypothetical protein BN946_scf184753.g4 [Trametes cinnabarina]
MDSDAHSGDLADTERTPSPNTQTYLADSGEEWEIPEVLQQFLDMMESPSPMKEVPPLSPSTPTRLQEHGPRNSTEAILHSYFRFNLPTPHVVEADDQPAPDPEALLLDIHTSRAAHEAFRKFLKVAASSCVTMSSRHVELEAACMAYTNILEAFAGLQDWLGTLPIADKSWIQGPNVTRLPSLLDSAPPTSACAHDNITAVDLPSFASDKSQWTAASPQGRDMASVSREHPDLEARTSMAHWLLCGDPVPYRNFFPLVPFELPADSDARSIPTSSPGEIEYPYTLVPSLETRLALKYRDSGVDSRS